MAGAEPVTDDELRPHHPTSRCVRRRGDAGGRRTRSGTRAGAPGSPALPARRPAAAHRHPARPRRRLPRPRRRQRPGRHRRRTRVGLPLLLARLPDPAPARRGRDVPGRPDRLRLPRPPPGGPRGHRVDPARRHPGPRLPGRGRAGPVRALRHRARGAAPGLPPGRPGHPGRDPAGLLDEEGALRSRLVDPAAARTVAGVRRSRRRGPRRAARRARGRAGGGRQGRVGATGVRRAAELHAGDALGAVASYVGPAPGPWPPPARRRPRALGDPRRARPGARRLARPDHRRRRDRRGRAGDADHPRRAARHTRVPRARRPALLRPLARGPGARRHDARGRPSGPRAPHGRPTHAPRVGRARPRRGRAAHVRARRHHVPLRRARHTGREPRLTRHRPARDVDAALQPTRPPSRNA